MLAEVSARALSWLWPVRVARAQGLHGPLEVRWERGRKVLNSANANQSFGSLHRVWQRTFARIGVHDAPPPRSLVLGLGAGSAVHILRKELGILTPITAVENDPAVIALAGAHFGLNDVEGLTIVEGDALVQVHALRERFALVVVDLFADLELAHGSESRAFIQGLRDRCTAGGWVCFNTVDHGPASHARCQRVLEHLRRVFHRVEELHAEKINRVFIARG